MSQSFRNLWKWLFETVIVLALVLFSFLTILAVLNLFFPSGQSFLEIIKGMKEASSAATAATRHDRQVMVGMGDQEKSLADLTTMTATLSRLHNSVKSRRSGDIAWKDATDGMALYDRDAVQTGKRSSARLTFGRDNYLDMHENSLMIFRNLDRDIFINTGRTVAVLVEGQFAGRVGKPDTGSMNVELVTPGAVARFAAPEGDETPASFKMVVNSDESSVLTVYQGKADLLFQDQMLVVGANQTVKVLPGRRPYFLPPPPRPPEPVLPEDGGIFAFRDIPPKVSFTWKNVKDSQRYRFMLAADEQFEQLLYEGTTTRCGFSHGNLKPGEYYWRVSSIGPGEEGKFGPVRRLRMIQDLEPPELDVNLSEGSPDRGDIILTGTTDADADLFVSGIPVVVDEQGRFEYRLDLKDGWNVIVVEAVDHVGNVAYFSSTLNAGF